MQSKPCPMAASRSERCGSCGQKGTCGEKVITDSRASACEVSGRLPTPVTAPAGSKVGRRRAVCDVANTDGVDGKRLRFSFAALKLTRGVNMSYVTDSKQVKSNPLPSRSIERIPIFPISKLEIGNIIDPCKGRTLRSS